MIAENKDQAWRLWLSYVGTKYCGWQRQPGQVSIESLLGDALEKILGGQKVTLTAAGRTDAGVHAQNQVVSCHFTSRFDAYKLVLALSSQLPDDVSVWRADIMPADFNAKRHSVGKQYIYRMTQGLVKDPFLYMTHWHLRKKLDVDSMQKAAAYFVGEHDFESFRSAQCGAAHARRYLWRVAVNVTNEHIYFDIRGNAFCHNMVRIIVGTLVDVGLNRLQADDMPNIIKQKNRIYAGKTAPPHGLSLANVYYPDDLISAEIPEGACFPRYPVTKNSWVF